MSMSLEKERCSYSNYLARWYLSFLPFMIFKLSSSISFNVSATFWFSNRLHIGSLYSMSCTAYSSKFELSRRFITSLLRELYRSARFLLLLVSPVPPWRACLLGVEKVPCLCNFGISTIFCSIDYFIVYPVSSSF